MFEAPTSYESPSYAPAGDIFPAASRAHIVDDFAMIFMGFRAIKARSLRFASSGDVVYISDRVAKVHIASGPGCIPSNSPLRPYLFPRFPACKRLRSNATVDSPSVLQQGRPVWNPSVVCAPWSHMQRRFGICFCKIGIASPDLL